MSIHGTLLPLPDDDPRVQAMRDDWPNPERWPDRARWLTDLETILWQNYPQASSADLRLTARWLAPFPLALGQAVP